MSVIRQRIRTSDVRRQKLMDAIRKQRGKCCWCGVQMKYPDPNVPAGPTTATREHMMPQLFGGTCAKGNIKAACKKCNNERGARMTSELEAERLKWAKPAGIPTRNSGRG